MASDLWWKAWLAMPDGVCVLDGDWTFRFLNAAGAGMLGHPAEDVVGGSLSTIFPATAGSMFETQLRRARDTATAVSWESSFSEDRGWFELHAIPVDDMLVVVFRNVDDRREVQHQRERLLARTRLLLSLAEVLADTSTVDEVAATVIDTATKELTSAHAGLSLVGDDYTGMRVRGIGQLDGRIQSGRPLALSASKVGRALHARQLQPRRRRRHEAGHRR